MKKYKLMEWIFLVFDTNYCNLWSLLKALIISELWLIS